MNTIDNFEKPGDWVGLVYKLGTLPSRNRVYVWRKLKDAGAVNVQQGMAILPRSENVLDFMQTIRQTILDFGGEAILAGVTFYNQADEQKAIDTFNTSLTKRFDEIRQVFLLIHEDLGRLRERRALTLSYLEEKLGILLRHKKIYEKIKLHDHFQAAVNRKFEDYMESSLKRINGYIAEYKKNQENFSL